MLAEGDQQLRRCCALCDGFDRLGKEESLAKPDIGNHESIGHQHKEEQPKAWAGRGEVAGQVPIAEQV